MLKLVESRELEIHSFLSSVKSRDNHTIPILHRLALGTKAIIVMPDELVLPYVANSVFETSGDDLASQFLAGVRFMHQQNVAHLDLKPENILVTLTTSPRLRICDYDVSVRVAGPESWITGYRGTPGWAAPEITEDPSNPYQPIRADLWSTGRVTEYIAHRQPAHASCLFKALLKRLLNHDPTKRPLLSEICLPHEEEQPQLKRKPSVEKGGVKRRRIHAGSQRVVPDILALPPVLQC
jgi:serine/threonine protein kinase